MRAESELVWPLPRSILNLARKNRDLVGLGSYIINAQAGCNDCHSCPSYAAGGNAYLRQPKQFNCENYLAGGVSFGPFTSRNLTPEQNRLPPASPSTSSSWCCELASISITRTLRLSLCFKLCL